MADLYGSMTELMENTVRGEDWEIYYHEEPESDTLSTAVHGGGIEVGTSEIALLTAEMGGYSYYIFETLRTSNNRDLHVTSINYDEPTILKLVSNHKNIISYHGAQGDIESTLIGGLDIPLRNAIWEELTRKGFLVEIAPPELAGVNPKNIGNRSLKGGGVQLELTTQMRKAFFKDYDWSRSKREDRSNWTQKIYDYAEAVITAVTKYQQKLKPDPKTTYVMDFNGTLNYGHGDNYHTKSKAKGEAKNELNQEYKLETVSNWIYPDETTIDGGKIKTNTILANKLVMGDVTNIIEDGTMKHGDAAWDLASTASVVKTTVPYSGDNVLRLQGTGVSNTYQKMRVPTKPGDVFHMEAMYRVPAASSGVNDARLVARFEKNDGTYTYSVKNIADYSSSWRRFSTTFESPDGVREVTFGVGVGVNNDPNSIIYFNSIECKKEISGEIITGTIDSAKTRIRGGSSTEYTLIEGNFLESRGRFTRQWFGETHTHDIKIKIENGYIRARNDTENKSLYFSDFGISTMADGLGAEDASGTLEFFSHIFDKQYRGVSLISNYGVLGFLSRNSAIMMESNKFISLESGSNPIYITPQRHTRSGDNAFTFWVKLNQDPMNSDGVLYFGDNYDGFSSGVRFQRNPNGGGYIWATDGSGTKGTGVFSARSFHNSSSIELKTNVEDMEDDGLYVINKLKPKKYLLKNQVEKGGYFDQQDYQVGLISELSPEVAMPGLDGIDLYRLLTFNVKATQELSSKHDVVEKNVNDIYEVIEVIIEENKDLKNKVIILENKMEELNNE